MYRRKGNVRALLGPTGTRTERASAGKVRRGEKIGNSAHKAKGGNIKKQKGRGG